MSKFDQSTSNCSCLVGSMMGPWMHAAAETCASKAQGMLRPPSPITHRHPGGRSTRVAPRWKWDRKSSKSVQGAGYVPHVLKSCASNQELELKPSLHTSCPSRSLYSVQCHDLLPFSTITYVFHISWKHRSSYSRNGLFFWRIERCHATICSVSLKDLLSKIRAGSAFREDDIMGDDRKNISYAEPAKPKLLSQE